MAVQRGSFFCAAFPFTETYIYVNTINMDKKGDDDYTKDSRKNPVFKNMNKVNRSVVQRDKKNHKVRAEYKSKVQREIDELDDLEIKQYGENSDGE